MFNLFPCYQQQEFHINPTDMQASPTQITIQIMLSDTTASTVSGRRPLETRTMRSELIWFGFQSRRQRRYFTWLNGLKWVLYRYGSYEQPVKQNVIQYKNQPGKIEHYTPGNSSVSEKEAKQVTMNNIRPRRQILTLPSQNIRDRALFRIVVRWLVMIVSHFTAHVSFMAIDWEIEVVSKLHPSPSSRCGKVEQTVPSSTHFIT